MQTKSPFIVVDNFISPLECEDYIDRLENVLPNTDEKNVPIRSIKENKLSEVRILPFLTDLIPQIEEYYGFNYYGTLPMAFEWYPEGCADTKPQCENSHYFRNQWRRTNIKDFCGIIFLNEYNDANPFDERFEVLGGKLAFPNHDFAFNPRRGTLIIFPGEQHFINYTTAIQVGSLHQIRFHIAAEQPYVYNPQNFKGSYKDWFSE